MIIIIYKNVILYISNHLDDSGSIVRNTNLAIFYSRINNCFFNRSCLILFSLDEANKTMDYEILHNYYINLLL